MGQRLQKEQKGISRFLQDFFHTEAVGGLVMVFAAILAIIFANHSALQSFYGHFINTSISLEFGDISLHLPLKKFVKDVFMVVFFMIVGLELKREMLEGFLSKKGQKLLPGIAAIGGIIVPAIFFSIITINNPEYFNGWAIPTATDIAFAVGVLAIVGRYMPPAAKIFLLAIAIYDDLAAIIIVALFYGDGFQVDYIIYIILVLAILYLLNKANVSYLTPYFLCCSILAVFLYKTGLHSTIAGVISAMFVPIRIEGQSSKTPLGTAIHFMHPWVSYFILPLFAFVSAGINFEGMHINDLFSTLPLAIGVALFFGKQIGIFGLTFITIQLGLAQKPEKSNWLDLYAMSVLAGIGFTMSLFIGLLAFDAEILQSKVKIGVVFGSILSTIWAVILIQMIQSKRKIEINSSQNEAQ